MGEPCVLGLHAAPDSDFVGGAVAGAGNVEGGADGRGVAFAGACVEVSGGGLAGPRSWMQHPQVRQIVVLEGSEMSAALEGWHRSGTPVQYVRWQDYRADCYTMLSAVSEAAVRIEESRWWSMAVNAAERQEASVWGRTGIGGGRRPPMRPLMNSYRLPLPGGAGRRLIAHRK